MSGLKCPPIIHDGIVSPAQHRGRIDFFVNCASVRRRTLTLALCRRRQILALFISAPIDRLSQRALPSMCFLLEIRCPLGVVLSALPVELRCYLINQRLQNLQSVWVADFLTCSTDVPKDSKTWFVRSLINTEILKDVFRERVSNTYHRVKRNKPELGIRQIFYIQEVGSTVHNI